MTITRGKPRANYPGRAGLVHHENASDWAFLYDLSLERDPKWYPGDRVMLPDGRVFKYAKAGSTIGGGFGAAFWRPLTFDGGTSGASLIGDTSVKITLDAGAITNFGSDITDNGFRGGFFSQPDNATPTFRGIIGNSPGADGDIITIFLDAPLTKDIVSGSFCELLANPYEDLRGTGGSQAGESGNDFISFAGIPATTVGTTANFFWVQTWGPIWITPNQPVADAASRRDVYFRNDGAIISGGDITMETGFQRAGFVIDKTGNGTDNPPIIMLQISP